MRRTNMEMAGDVLKQFLENTSIGSSMSQQEAIELWPKVAGEAIGSIKTRQVPTKTQTRSLLNIRPLTRTIPSWRVWRATAVGTSF